MEIKIGTFNIAAGRHADFWEIGDLLKRNDLDIVGLQEVDRMTNRSQKSDVLKQISHNNYNEYFAPTMEFDGGQYGIGLLTNHDLQHHDYFKYDKFGSEPRIFQTGEVLFDNRNINVYNTHLSLENKEIRFQQIQQLLTYAKNNRYIIVTGDFNYDQSKEEWDQLRDQFYLANGDQNNWLDTFVEEEDLMQSFAIDNILISKNMIFRQISLCKEILSDHLLLTATIDFV